MENKDKLFKFNKDITWSLPVLCRYEPAWGAIYKCLQQIDVTLPRINAYGSPPNDWTAGRIPAWVGDINKNAITTTFNYLMNLNATPSLTFTYRGITKENLKDPQANYLLDIALEAKAHFIVYSDLLKDYIKEKDPDAYVVASVIKAQEAFQHPLTLPYYEEEKETEFYNKLLKEYDMVVVRPEYAIATLADNPTLIEDLSRIEVLINQQCITNCPRMAAHCTLTEKYRKRDKLEINPNFRCLRNDMSGLKEVYENSNTLNGATTKKLVDAGVRHLKLQGRGGKDSIHHHTLRMFAQMFYTNGAPYVLIEELLGHAIDKEINYYVNLMNQAADENCKVIHY